MCYELLINAVELANNVVHSRAQFTLFGISKRFKRRMIYTYFLLNFENVPVEAHLHSKLAKLNRPKNITRCKDNL